MDECAGCGGIWPDYGELGKIRNLYNSEEEKEKATKEFLNATAGKQLAEMKAEKEAELQRARKFANIFHFICPSYWIPGKQEGAAF